MADVNIKDKEKIYSKLDVILEDKLLNNEEKLNHCLNILNPGNAFGEILFALTPDEKPYFSILKSIIEIIKDKLLQKLIPAKARELIIAIRTAMLTVLATIVESQDVSEFDKIAICYEMINPKKNHIKMHFISSEVIGNIKKTIDNINRLNIQVPAAKNNNNNYKSLPAEELIAQLQKTIYLILEKQIQNNAINASENITAWCDAISPTGQMGEILFTPSKYAQSHLEAGLLKSVKALIYGELNQKIMISAKPIILYEKLDSLLTSIKENAPNGQYKSQLTKLLSEIKDLKNSFEFIRKKYEKIYPYYQLRAESHANSIIKMNSSQNESVEYKALANSIRNPSYTYDFSGQVTQYEDVSKKITQCGELIPVIAENGVNLKQALILVERYLIPKIMLVTDARTLKNILEGIQSVVLSQQNETQNRYNKMVASLECLIILLQTNNPHDSDNKASIAAAHSGIEKCWSHIYSEFNRTIKLTRQQNVNQGIRLNSFSELFGELNSVIKAITQPDRNVNIDNSNISEKADEILKIIKNNEQDTDLFLFEQYDEIMKQLSEAQSIFDIRDIFYKVVGIDAQELHKKMQRSDNIIDLSENPGTAESQSGENIKQESTLRLN